MNCDEADALLLDYAEGELDGPQSDLLRSHLEACQSCRLHLRDTKKLLGAIDDVKDHQQRLLEKRAARRTRMGRSADRSASLSATSPPVGWSPGSRLGDFEIISEIGRGGMGVVYRARQVSLHREVALKILPAAFGNDEKVIARFQREAQAAARLHHTNIVPVYAQGQQDGHFYYAMELIDGESLDHVIRARSDEHSASASGRAAPESVSQSKIQNLKSKISASGITRTIWTMQAHGPWRDYAALICGAAEGLAHAHSEGVLHRDIKPQNLLLGADNQLHITDFGLARLLDEPGMTVTGEMLGTPAYMSPEQVAADRRAIDHRTDIFSLGSTFYELLSGQRPFEGSTRDQVIARICTRDPRPLRKINPRIPTDLETICLRALEKEPSRRYQSAADMAADLRRYSENRPILARRVGPIEKAVKWVRRHPAMTTIILLVFFLIAGGISWRIQAVRARHEKARELVARAFSLLADEDYREPIEPRRLLTQAAALRSPDAFHAATLGLSYLRNEPDTAMTHLQTALGIARDDQALRCRILYLMAWAERQRTGHLAGPAQRFLQEADNLGGAQTPEEHFFRGMALVKHRPEEAIKEYRSAYQIRNNYAQAILQLGRGLNSWMYHERRHDNFGEQTRVLENACLFQARKAYPRYLLSIAHRISAEIYEQDGKPDLAEKDFEAALRYARLAQDVEPDSPRGYVCEAEYWESRLNFAEAILARNKSESRCHSQDDFAELYQYRWRLYYWTNQYDKALADLTELVGRSQLSGNRLDHHGVWAVSIFPAMIRLDMNQRDAAIKMLDELIAREPDNFCAVTSAAALLQIAGEHDKARELLDVSESRIVFSAFQQGPNQPPSWPRHLYQICRGRRTIADLENEVGAHRKSEKLLWPAAYFLTACRQLGAGKKDAARQSFHRCVQTFDYEDYCYLAKVFLIRMQMEENWPNWVKTHP